MSTDTEVADKLAQHDEMLRRLNAPARVFTEPPPGRVLHLSPADQERYDAKMAARDRREESARVEAERRAKEDERNAPIVAKNDQQVAAYNQEIADHEAKIVDLRKAIHEVRYPVSEYARHPVTPALPVPPVATKRVRKLARGGK